MNDRITLPAFAD